MSKEGDVSCRVARDVEDPEAGAETGYYHFPTFFQRHCDYFTDFPRRAEHRAAMPRSERGSTAYMIGMVMGGEHSPEFKIPCIERVLYRHGIAWIHHRGVAGLVGK